MPDDKKVKKEEFYTRGDRFIYNKKDLDYVLNPMDSIGIAKSQPVLLKKMIPDNKKIN